MRILVIGTGSIGRRHARVVHSVGGHELILADRREDFLDELKAELAPLGTFTDYRDALTLEPEAASVITLVHGDLHRPKFGGGPTFRLTLPGPGALAVHVNSVAPLGAALVITVDGQEALRRDLPDTDGEGNPHADEYGEVYTVELAAGQHDVRIDNAGGDWLSVDRYVFHGLR